MNKYSRLSWAASIYLATGFSIFTVSKAQETPSATKPADALKGLSASYNPETGVTRWMAGGKLLRETLFRGDVENPSYSPDGMAVHLGSFKESSSTRVMVAFRLRNDTLQFAGGDDLSQKVKVVLLNSEKIPQTVDLQKCWIDPIRWIGESKLLITAYMVAPGPGGFEVADYRCVWNISDDTCTYVPEFRSEKETIVKIQANDEKKAEEGSMAEKSEPGSGAKDLSNDIVTKNAKKLYTAALNGEPSMLDWTDTLAKTEVETNSQMVNNMIVTQQGTLIWGVTTPRGHSDSDRFFSDLQIKGLIAQLDKYEEWRKIAEHSPTESFSKDIPTFGIVSKGIFAYNPKFTWDNERKIATYETSFYECEFGEAGVESIRKLITYIPIARAILRAADAKTNDKFK